MTYKGQQIRPAKTFIFRFEHTVTESDLETAKDILDENPIFLRADDYKLVGTRKPTSEELSYYNEFEKEVIDDMEASGELK
ncbi:MAG: hypothetical protein KJI69_04510 [Patescibacteria group bacterium]|nr:hypothetical protein [Patescibacteria group bacterium]